MTDRERLLDDLARVFAHAAVDRLLLEEGLGLGAAGTAPEMAGDNRGHADNTAKQAPGASRSRADQ